MTHRYDTQTTTYHRSPALATYVPGQARQEARASVAAEARAVIAATEVANAAPATPQVSALHFVGAAARVLPPSVAALGALTPAVIAGASTVHAFLCALTLGGYVLLVSELARGVALAGTRPTTLAARVTAPVAFIASAVAAYLVRSEFSLGVAAAALFSALICGAAAEIVLQFWQSEHEELLDRRRVALEAAKNAARKVVTTVLATFALLGTAACAPELNIYEGATLNAVAETDAVVLLVDTSTSTGGGDVMTRRCSEAVALLDQTLGSAGRRVDLAAFTAGADATTRGTHAVLAWQRIERPRAQAFAAPGSAEPDPFVAVVQTFRERCVLLAPSSGSAVAAAAVTAGYELSGRCDSVAPNASCASRTLLIVSDLQDNADRPTRRALRERREDLPDPLEFPPDVRTVVCGFADTRESDDPAFAQRTLAVWRALLPANTHFVPTCPASRGDR